mgnify:CR=1 FL=1
MPTPDNSRRLLDGDLTVCHRCGDPAAGWTTVLGRAVGVCVEHRGPVVYPDVEQPSSKP